MSVVTNQVCANYNDGKTHEISLNGLRQDPSVPHKSRKLCDRCYETAFAVWQREKDIKCANTGDGNMHPQFLLFKVPTDSDKTRRLCRLCYSKAQPNSGAANQVCANYKDGKTHEISSNGLRQDPSIPYKSRKLCDRCYMVAFDTWQKEKDIKCANTGDGNMHTQAVLIKAPIDSDRTRRLCRLCYIKALSNQNK